jgi:uncharacterized damage-inducible protein DinB
MPDFYGSRAFSLHKTLHLQSTKTCYMNTKKLLSLGVACIALASLISFNLIEKESPVSKGTSMIADWERAKLFTKEYIDASNDDVINFKPTAEMRTFGQQMLHLADGNYGLISAASGKTGPSNFGDLEKKSDQFKTKDALLKAVMDSYDFAISSLKDTDDAKMAEKIKMFDMFEITREAGFQKAFEHQTHHRGQATVYLRLKGVKPPQEKLF